MSNNSNNPINLFFTKHFLSVLGVYYISTLSPTIDKILVDGKLTNQEIGHLINTTLVSIFGASLKGLDKDVYTPKGLPGKNKDDILNNNNIVVAEPIIEKPILNPISSLSNININSDLQLSFDNDKTSLLLIAKQETYYKLEPIDSSNLNNTKKIKVKSNNQIYIDDYAVDINTNHISFNIKDRVFYAFIPHISLLKDGVNITFSNNFRPTIEQCNTIYDTTLTNNEYTDMINCLNTFNINTKLDVAHFISQTAHESGGLRYSKEIADGKDYEFREDLGNTEPGDGPKFKGGGFIQLTGRANYQALSRHLNDPKVMEGVDYVANNLPFTSAGFWWFNNKMSSYINDGGATVEEVSLRVNGGYNGLSDRISYFKKAKQVFNLI